MRKYSIVYRVIIIMNFEAMTDEAIAAELGRRIEQIRLERNLTQQQLADAVGLSRISYRKLELGEAKFVNVVAVLRVLDQMSLLENFVPKSVFSPLEQLKMKGKQRQRATGSRGQNQEQSDECSVGNFKNASDELDW